MAPSGLRARPVAAWPHARNAAVRGSGGGKPALMMPEAHAVGVGASSAAFVRPARRDNAVTMRCRAGRRGASPQARVFCCAVRFWPTLRPDLSLAWFAFPRPARAWPHRPVCAASRRSRPLGQAPIIGGPPGAPTSGALARRDAEHAALSGDAACALRIGQAATCRQFSSGSWSCPSSPPQPSATQTHDNSVLETSRVGQHMAIRGAR
jgi:hypothetical protein